YGSVVGSGSPDNTVRSKRTYNMIDEDEPNSRESHWIMLLWSIYMMSLEPW
ncbi:hypothetical protein ACJX0J_030994, partial [Zea mays]